MTADIIERNISNQKLLSGLDLVNEVLNVLLDNMLDHSRKGGEEADKVGDLRLHLNECADALNEDFLDAVLEVA